MNFLDVLTQAIAAQNSGPFPQKMTPEQKQWDPLFGYETVEKQGKAPMIDWAIGPQRRADAANNAWVNSESAGLANAISALIGQDQGIGSLFQNQPSKQLKKKGE